MRLPFFQMVASALLVTFFLSSCSSFSSVQEPTQDADWAKEPVSTDASTTQELEKTSKDLYNDAFEAYDIARTQQVDERSGYYQTMLDLLQEVQEKASQEQNITMATNAIKLNAFVWEKEHNDAIHAMQSTPSMMELALAHASNAVFLMPDSLRSYELLAQLHYMSDQTDEAVRVIDLVLSNLELKATDKERLTNKKDFLSSSAQALSTEELWVDNLPIPYKVINALLDEQNWFEAINVLEAERSKKPEQKQLIHTLALVHYKITALRMQPILERINRSRTGKIRLTTSEKAQLNEADTHYQQAEELFNELKRTPSIIKNYDLDIAYFYQNGAIQYNKLRNANWLPNYAFDLRVTNYANKSIDSYRALLEEMPEKKEYWSRIAQLYELSGKQREADQAKRKSQ